MRTDEKNLILYEKLENSIGIDRKSVCVKDGKFVFETEIMPIGTVVINHTIQFWDITNIRSDGKCLYFRTGSKHTIGTMEFSAIRKIAFINVPVDFIAFK